MLRHVRIAFGVTLTLIGTISAAPPKVVITSPDNGEIDVDPAVTEIRVEYDQPMSPNGMSVLGGGPTFPEISGKITWANPKTLVIPVTLKPDQQYQMNFNSDTFRNFQNARGEPAEWYPLRFKTRAAGAAPAEPDVTAEQNKDALAELKRAIDEEYAYRDRKKIDWAKEIEKRRAKFEAAKSANEFARLTVHLLRLAEDAHVTVEAGDVRLGTRANSMPPNFHFPRLQKAVPGWKEHRSGIVSGRFDDGVGYILFSDCSKQQAEGFDAALDELKDAKALILDARPNGGGDELAARRVAGRFIEKPAVYSKNRLREGGNWKGPFDRTVEPRKDAERFAKPVAVLIGPKIGSSAESFVLMLKHGAGANLIGGVTKGSSGRPIPHQLGNGVTVYLSSWEDQLPDGTILEGRGVRPDTVIKTTPDDFESSDPVLDAALKLLRRKDARAAKSPAQ